MVLLRRRLACCTWNREVCNSIDFDQPPNGIMTYNGLESCILSANSCEDESDKKRRDECQTDDDSSSCFSSNVSGSLSSHSTMMKTDDQQSDEWEHSETPKRIVAKGKSSSHVDIMKETFAKLLLGEDSTGGSKGHSSALALSNSITKLAASVFGELWKLEPLTDEKKSRWKREMEWLLSPTDYMVELVPAKQYDGNGRTLEIMRPKARVDVHMNLPALRKLDSMLLETLDAKKNTEFWYKEVSQVDGKRWLPILHVPEGGLSGEERKRLLNQAKIVYQIFKAAKSINETILLEMPIPKIIGEALPMSGKASLGDDLYRILNTSSSSAVGMLNSLNLKSEHAALDTINRLEAAIYAWIERISIPKTATKSPFRTSWSLKDPSTELDKIEFLTVRAELLLQEIKNRYPNLPQTFLNVMKIQYGKDIAHAILEAYSRVLGNLAFNILTRIRDICQEDVSVYPNSPMAMNGLPGIIISGISGIPISNVSSSHTLFDQVNNTEGKLSLLTVENASYTARLNDETIADLVTVTPSRCCIGKEVCFTPPKMSP